MRLIFETSDADEVAQLLELCRSLSVASVQIVSNAYELPDDNTIKSIEDSERELIHLWEFGSTSN